MKIKKVIFFTAFLCFFIIQSNAQPNWPAIKANATFIVHDTSYATPYIQPLNVGGWEDGLYITRDGLHLFSTYLPVDVFSWLYDLILDPVCFDFSPYFRPPLLDIDTITNIWGCPNFMQSDIVISSRNSINDDFVEWRPSNLQMSFSFDGGAQGVMKNADTFDVFVYTRDGVGTQGTDIMFMKNVPINPSQNSATPIFVTEGAEDNPHIERLNDTTLVILFDRDRYMYYSLSYDNGDSWLDPILITQTLNDQAPYDVQPHLWHDGNDWWVYFCADNSNFRRCIYKSKQMIENDWNSWGPKQLVIESGDIIGGYGYTLGIGEPTLTQWGDLSFVVIYGDLNSPDTTDMYDCDPWFLPKKNSPVFINKEECEFSKISVYPNPAKTQLNIRFEKADSYQISMYSIDGRLVVNEKTTNAQHSINVASLNKGIYLLKISDENKSKMIKVVIQ